MRGVGSTIGSSPEHERMVAELHGRTSADRLFDVWPCDDAFPVGTRDVRAVRRLAIDDDHIPIDNAHFEMHSREPSVVGEGNDMSDLAYWEGRRAPDQYCADEIDGSPVVEHQSPHRWTHAHLDSIEAGLG